MKQKKIGSINKSRVSKLHTLKFMTGIVIADRIESNSKIAQMFWESVIYNLEGWGKFMEQRQK